METQKQLNKKREELENQIITRGWDKLGNNRELEKLEEKIKYVKSFIEFIKSLKLDIRTEYIILEKITGEELRARP